ncbi:nuclear transport factor 2 family protein [Streptomyces sp. NPDC050560]|uniref:nuclear transport factor 2 family protein n=1 Tax=Streptomyces sp. NPDC050560 TaxID=3365630 RepID=UPI0037A2E426
MIQSVRPADGSVDSALYLRVQQFYARQMHALDGGDAQAWADTFTADGEFAANAHPEPVRGRSAIHASAREAAAKLAEQGIVRRHWLGMLDVSPGPDGALHTRCYALIVESPRHGRPDVRLSTLCEDVLVPEGDGWLVSSRRVTRDDLR